MKLTEIRVDGFKNLAKCRIPLGDFNVLVGPNNSGKSNLLQVFEMLLLTSFSSDDTRESVFRGYSGREHGCSICHLNGSRHEPISIGFTFETTIETEQGDVAWLVDYDMAIHCDFEDAKHGGFKTESLRAKPRGKTGRAKSYIERNGKALTIVGKRHSIASHVSSLSALRVLYPEFKKLRGELAQFFTDMLRLSLTSVFAISPDTTRKVMGEEIDSDLRRRTFFDCLKSIDEIHRDRKRFKSFKENVCDILGLEDLRFTVTETSAPSAGGEKNPKKKRTRFCFLKRKGSDYAELREFSDGTISVVALLVALFSQVTPKPPIICIEEPENFLHPAALAKLLVFLQDSAHEWPILLTTHSPYLVNGVRPQDIIVAVVDDSGTTHFEKPKNRRAIRERLNRGYMNFGDLLVTNFRDML